MMPLIIVRQPFAEGKPISSSPPTIWERKEGERLSDALMEISPSRFHGMHIELFRGNYCVDAQIDLADAADIVLRKNDRYIVMVLPSAALAIGSIASNFLVSAAVGFGISFLSAALRPTPWVGPGAAARTKATPLNQLDPPRNQPRLGSRIPSLYGELRTWPDLIYPPYEEWGGEEGTEGRIQNLQSVYCVTEGQASLDQFYVGDTPVSNIGAATVTVLDPGDPLPTTFNLVQSNSIFANVPMLMAQEWPDPSVGNLDGWETANGGFTDWIRLPQGNASQIWTQIALPNGSLKSEFKYGTSGTFDHNLAIEYRRIDAETGDLLEGPYSYEWRSYNKTTSPLRFTDKRFLPTPGLWEVRYRREDNDLTREYDPGRGIDQYNRGLTIVEAQGYSVLTGAQRVNDTTRVHLSFTNLSASAQVSINSQSRFNVVATRVLPEVKLDGSGIGAPIATTRWIDAMYHQLTDPQLGAYAPTEIDTDSLITVQKTMSSHVPPTDPAAGEYNAMWDSILSVDEQIQTTARAARASLFSDGANVISVIDADNRLDEDGGARNAWEIVTALFNRRNRATQDIDAGVTMKAALPTEPDGVEITWIDRTANWATRKFTYTPSGSATALRPIRVEAKGLTDWTQVWRHAQYIYKRQLYRRKSTSVNTFEEARLLQLLDTVSVVQPWREIVTDGQIVFYEVPSPGLFWVTIDYEVAGLTPFTDTIRIRSSDGTETELFDIVEVDETDNRLRLGVRGGTDPHIPMILGSPAGQVGMIYQIATDADDQADQWLVLASNAQSYDGTLTLTNSDNRVFDGDKLAAPGYDSLPFTTPRVPDCSQHPCLAFWYYPAVDANLSVRATRFQETFDLQLTTSGAGDNFNEIGRGFRSRPGPTSGGWDRDELEITAAPRSNWDWWITTGSGDPQPQRGIFFWHLELTSDVISQANAGFLFYFRQFNTEWYALRMRADAGGGSELEFSRANGTTSGSIVCSLVDNSIATEYIIAATFDATSPNQYAYVGQPLISPGTSVRREGSSVSLANLSGGWNYWQAGGDTGSNSVDGTFYLREFRVYNCIPNEQFVEDLGAGLIDECNDF